MIESLQQVQVVSALARLAGYGGWERILTSRPLEDRVDRADAELLVAAGVLRATPDGRLVPVDLHPWYADPEVLATGLVAELRRALQHGLDRDAEIAQDPDEIAAMGMASRSVADTLADAVLPMLPTTRDRLDGGSGRFLDVGVGTGAICEALCREYGGLTAVGLDVSTDALVLAEERLAESPVADRVELREQSVCDLREEEAYDLAWLPQVFVAPCDLAAGLARVHAALRPGCWLVMPVAASAEGSSTLERAALAHEAVIRGGGPMSVEEAGTLLREAGFVELRDMAGVSQSLVMARRAAA